MSCNSVIHDELKKTEETICPFCDETINECFKMLRNLLSYAATDKRL